jgi:hypothetical protein
LFGLPHWNVFVLQASSVHVLPSPQSEFFRQQRPLAQQIPLSQWVEVH